MISYVVYKDGWPIANGSLQECADQMGLTYSSIKTMKSRRQGGYEFIEVIDDDRPHRVRRRR